MSRDVSCSISEVKATINSIESRERGAMEEKSMGSLKTPYTGGKVRPTGKTFSKPSTGGMRKHME